MNAIMKLAWHPNHGFTEPFVQHLFDWRLQYCTNRQYSVLSWGITSDYLL